MNPMEHFVPPTPQMPTQGANTPDSGIPQQINNVAGSQEKQSQWAKSVGRSHQIKAAAKTVIQTRSQLAAYLQQSGLQLLTSSIEFQNTGDFILSSYVVYPQYGNQKEPLAQFISRYPQLQEPVAKIRDSLRPAQAGMQVVTRRQY
jgi:hypothetical protein